jgi:phenylacetate-CoA ligase
MQQHCFREAIVRSVAFPTIDLLLGQGFRSKYEELLAARAMTRPEVRERQLERIRRLLVHAYDTVPYYRDLLDLHGIRPESVTTFDGFASIPPTTKQSLRQAGRGSCISRAADFSRCRSNRTSGSTGEPFAFTMDANLLASKGARYLHALGETGFHLGHRYMKLWGRATSSTPQRWFLRWVLSRRELDAFSLDDAKSERLLASIASYRPDLLECYASSVRYLASFARSARRQIHVPVVVTSAEHLHDDHREAITEAFGAKVFNRYGSREFGNIAQDCEERRMHVVESCFYVESENGRLLVTCFDNEAMPFIRYDMGDLGNVSHEPCPCGRPTSWITDLVGRTSEVFVTPEGIQVPPTYFYYAIDHRFGRFLQRFQVVVRSDGSLRVLLVPNRSFEKAHGEAILKALRGGLGTTHVELELVDRVRETDAGKVMAVVRG